MLVVYLKQYLFGNRFTCRTTYSFRLFLKRRSVHNASLLFSPNIASLPTQEHLDSQLGLPLERALGNGTDISSTFPGQAPNTLDSESKSQSNTRLYEDYDYRNHDYWIHYHSGILRKAQKNSLEQRRYLREQTEKFCVELLQRTPPGKETRSILRAQIAQARNTKDILRVVAVAVQKRRFLSDLGIVTYFLLHSLYRMRMCESDVRILTVIMIIYKRLKMVGIDLSYECLGMGLTFSARARSLKGMKIFLSELQKRGLPMGPTLFRSLIAKFSIGTRGLGQIRNGSWKRDELVQVLLGFPGTPKDDEPFHLETFLIRENWQFLTGWLAVLAWCQAKDELWKEWELWLANPIRVMSRELKDPGAKSPSVKIRGDRWFIEQFLNAEDPPKAWRAFEESGLTLDQLRPSIRQRLLDTAVYAKAWPAYIVKALEQKVEEDLADITTALTGEEGFSFEAFSMDD